MGKQIWILLYIKETPATEPNGVDTGGAFSTEKKAIEACHGVNCFIGPLNIDEILPESTMDWPGGYYPFVDEEL